ncbi:hypothetical protein [Rhizobium sp. BR 362]|uniref:hypothetical protein n=1 Tax=Rhizobium sp. BR 362 TaxID=3040670 RepID=UPI002F43010A
MVFHGGYILFRIGKSLVIGHHAAAFTLDSDGQSALPKAINRLIFSYDERLRENATRPANYFRADGRRTICTVAIPGSLAAKNGNALTKVNPKDVSKGQAAEKGS